MLDKFLAPDDRSRAAKTSNRLASHDLCQLTLAGGFAIDLFNGQSLSPNFARDLLRLLELVSPEQVEMAWQDHRKPAHSPTFAEAAEPLRHQIAMRHELLAAHPYSTDSTEVCTRCRHALPFQLADPGSVLALLGCC